ncbi:hypothetical protein A1O7_01399 [Cladophialophora yegresii CBS 114405]|uniref:GH16 domain-containing protein n=1 Tax=Cladophialophora yegresii CBS 114405 TaxID=1182544 RepID=W9X3I8_9EURO|nr:uncharacterized protein A1O7_01399 [Cladophialophora yegresii CBS 114405]EXJ65059.1 hypothetical protein A1O7_01399 [Cladophialophora yegresii CBS 114405]
MPSPSLFLGSSTTLVSALLLLSSSAAATSDTYYALDTDYSGRDFFDGFNFFTDADPTHGFVTYVDEGTALADGLITTRGGSAQIKVDSTHTYDGTVQYSGINGVGRPSVRIESINSWTHGLFIADIKHMPTTTDSSGCSVWPAFWTLGSGTWPYNGEIDIIEGANNQANDLTSTHTGGSCMIAQSPLEMTGTSNGNDCRYDVATGANAQGCGAFSKSSVSYGAGFNSNKGGVYAMEWKSDAIKIWFFPRGSIPSDITSGNPDPSGWGLPDSIFNGPGCDIDANFADNRFIFDTTFCGDFGEATWYNGGCAAIEGDQCSVFVGDHPEQFTEAYWDVNYVRVYQSKPVTHTSSSTTSTMTTSSSSTWTTPHTTTAETTTTKTTTSQTTTTKTTTSESTTLPYTHSHSFGGPTGTTSAPATTTTTWYTTSSSPSSPTTSPYIHTTTSSPGAGSETTTWAHSHSGSSATTTPTTSESPATTPYGSWDGTTSSFAWQDWESSTKPTDPVTTSLTTSSFDWADWESSTKPADPVTTPLTTSSFDWADWESSVSSTSKPADPVTTSSSPSSSWADWEASKSSTMKPNDPVTTGAFTWSDWNSDPSVAPTSTATWADWNSESSIAPISTATSTLGALEGKPSSPVVVAAASAGSSTWASPSPSVTIATTVTVAPVASSAWVAAASATPVAPYSGNDSAGTPTSAWVAAYTGAAGRTGMNAVALLGAGAVAFAVLAL